MYCLDWTVAALIQEVALAVMFWRLLLGARQDLASVFNGLATGTDLGWHGSLAVHAGGVWGLAFSPWSRGNHCPGHCQPPVL